MTDPQTIASKLTRSEGLSYLLIKRGLYYRPDNCGYTGVKEYAGRYMDTDADELSGVTAIHEDEAPLFAPSCWNDVKVKYLLAVIAEKDAELAAVRTHLEKSASPDTPKRPGFQDA